MNPTYNYLFNRLAEQLNLRKGKPLVKRLEADVLASLPEHNGIRITRVTYTRRGIVDHVEFSDGSNLPFPMDRDSD